MKEKTAIQELYEKYSNTSDSKLFIKWLTENKEVLLKKDENIIVESCLFGITLGLQTGKRPEFWKEDATMTKMESYLSTRSIAQHHYNVNYKQTPRNDVN